MSVPFVAFTVYAALTQVPEELIEAAEIDGAGPWQRLRHVILPTIRPVLLVVLLLQVIWDLRVFTQIYVLQKAGGVTRDTNLLGTYIYRLGIGSGDFGTAAAVAIFMLVLTVVLTAPYVRMMLKQESAPDAPPRLRARCDVSRQRRRPRGLPASACSRSTGWSTPRCCRAARSGRPTRPGCRSAAPSTTTAGSSTGDQFLDALDDEPDGHAGHGRGRAGRSRSWRRSRSPGSGSAAAGAFMVTLLLIQMIPVEGAVHLPVQDARGDAPAQHRRRPDAGLRRVGAALHDLDPARLRRRRARTSWRRPR